MKALPPARPNSYERGFFPPSPLLSSDIFEALFLHVDMLEFPLKYLRNWSLLGNHRTTTLNTPLPHAWQMQGRKKSFPSWFPALGFVYVGRLRNLVGGGAGISRVSALAATNVGFWVEFHSCSAKIAIRALCDLYDPKHASAQQAVDFQH